MSDDSVILRPVREADLVVLDRFLAGPEETGGFQWLGWSDPGLWRRRWEENGLLSEDKSQLLVVSGSDEPLGFVSWHKMDAWGGGHYWNMGAQLLPEVRGRGIGTRAQRMLVDYLFATTTVVRIEADTETENIAEQRALEKAGFTREGVQRSVNFRDGRWRDGVRYSVLREEWAAGRSTAEGSAVDASPAG